MDLKRGEQEDGSTQGWEKSMSKEMETRRENVHVTKKKPASLVWEDVP